MAKKSTYQLSPVVNRRARFDYLLKDELICGMVLTGQQVRLIRDAHAQLTGSYVTIRRGELWLLGLTLGSEAVGDIKLLATKKQIEALLRAKVDGNTIVPTRLLPAKRHIKIAIAVARGKKKYDKRQSLKARDLEREQRRKP